MPRVLHLLTSGDHPAALSVIERQARQPDTTVTVVLLHGTSAPALPDRVTVRRVTEEVRAEGRPRRRRRGAPQGEAQEDARSGDLTYSELLDLIFAADSVIAW